MLSPSLPPGVEDFDDTFEVPAYCVRETMMLSVDIVSPGGPPMDITGTDRVILQKEFRDAVPWIIIRLIEPGSPTGG